MDEADEMFNLISHLSEEAYAAGWMKDSEYDVWRLATEGGSWGRIEAQDETETLDSLLRLSGERSEWMTWSAGPVPVALDEWRQTYRDWRNGPSYNPHRDKPTR
jgi:hypothetical protein